MSVLGAFKHPIYTVFANELIELCFKTTEDWHVHGFGSLTGFNAEQHANINRDIAAAGCKLITDSGKDVSTSDPPRWSHYMRMSVTKPFSPEICKMLWEAYQNASRTSAHTPNFALTLSMAFAEHRVPLQLLHGRLAHVSYV
jgi:hypothetical protein